MRFGSLFAGVGGFDLGFEQAGMECVWQVENDVYCCAVLHRHWPLVERRGDIVGLEKVQLGPVDLICGGFPCQDVSVAGNRKGLAGERSGLWSEFHRILEELRPAWVVVENVTGLLSSQEGRDFATILHALVQVGYGVTWRVLDAQYFGVPQRRRRVFIVGHLGDGRAAEVLFESESGAWNPPPSREARAQAARDTAASTGVGGDAVGFSFASHPLGIEELAEPLTCRRGDPGCVARPVTTSGGQRWDDTSETYITVADVASTLVSPGRQWNSEQNLPNLITTADNQPAPTKYSVRRLMPVECERLQGFPDDWTGGQSDSRRYKQLGNAVCVPVARWIGERIIDSQ